MPETLNPKPYFDVEEKCILVHKKKLTVQVLPESITMSEKFIYPFS